MIRGVAIQRYFVLMTLFAALSLSARMVFSQEGGAPAAGATEAAQAAEQTLEQADDAAKNTSDAAEGAAEQVGNAAQEAAGEGARAAEGAKDAMTDLKDKAVEMGKDVIEGGAKIIDDTAKAVNANPESAKISAGILDPIYKVAERLNIPQFHWLAFAFMMAGVVCYALQLVLGKLVVLAHLHFSITEILSDALCLVISVVGLVLTTQAAAENSEFTRQPFMVISAAVVGLLLGLRFYLWGQSQELKAAQAERAAKVVVRPAANVEKR